MATHFLLSAAARTLSFAKVARMTEEEGRDAFRMIRWADTERRAGLPALWLPRRQRLQVAADFQMQRVRASIFVSRSGTIFASPQAPGPRPICWPSRFS